jgi:hypothetical protein
VFSPSQAVTISPIAARAKGESESRLRKSAGEIVGSIIRAAIPAVVIIAIVIMMIVTSRRAVVTIMMIILMSRPVVVMMAGVMVISPPRVAVVIASEVRRGVSASARISETGSSQDHYCSDYNIFQNVAFHGGSPVIIGSF